MKLPHDRKHLEHELRGLRGSTPVSSAERYLRYLLTGAEAVINRAAPKTPLSQAVVDTAAVIGLQIRTGAPGILIDCEVSRCCIRQRNAAQAEAVLAIALQTQAALIGSR